MTISIEDSPRNLAKWVRSAAEDGLARGLTINPWATPWVKLQNRKRTAVETAEVVSAGGGEIWFDPLTHALQMSGVGDFRFYDEFSLWSGTRGDLTTGASRAEHLRRVFAIQDELDAPRLAPTWTGEQVARFLLHDTDDRWLPLWTLLAATGQRRGEAAGLVWDDEFGPVLDLDAATVRVERATAELGRVSNVERRSGVMLKL